MAGPGGNSTKGGGGAEPRKRLRENHACSVCSNAKVRGSGWVGGWVGGRERQPEGAGMGKINGLGRGRAGVCCVCVHDLIEPWAWHHSFIHRISSTHPPTFL